MGGRGLRAAKMQLCTQAALSFNFQNIPVDELFFPLLECVGICQTSIQLFLSFFSPFQTNFRDDVDDVFPVYVVK